MNLCRPSYLRRNGYCCRILHCVRYLCITIAVLITIYMVVINSRVVVLNDSWLQLEKCPACFGIWENVCQAILSGLVEVKDNYFWNSEFVKGVWYGTWDGLPVVLKQLGSSGELATLDQQICLNVTEPVSKYCNVHENVWRSFLNPAVSFKSAVLQSTECPCEQFALLLENRMKNEMNVTRLDRTIMALTNLYFNQEFLFLQVFSKRYSNFLPELYGACGRAIMVEYVGPTLSSVLDRPWQERVKLSIKLIHLARSFTRTNDNMALYMNDVVMSNFAVDKHGNVKLIDCEHVLIVDMSSFNHTYTRKSEDFCAHDHFQCLTFVPKDLCQGEAQDHNYYAICRNILAAIGGSRGLLHSPPNGKIKSTLKYLLYNCVYSNEMSRERAIDKLEKQLYRYTS